MKQLVAFCDQRSIQQRFISTDGHVQLSSDTQAVRLHCGMKSLSAALDMRHTPKLVNDYKPLPYRFQSEYFADGYDASTTTTTMATKAIITIAQPPRPPRPPRDHRDHRGHRDHRPGGVIFVCTSIVDISINRVNLAPPTWPDVLVTGR